MTNVDFTPEDSAILLIDHQDGTLKWVKSQPTTMTVANVRMLARLGAEVGMPLIVSSTSEQQIGPNLRDIQELAPQQYANRIKRGAVFNAFLVDEFRQAVEATGRKNLIIAGLTTDVCAFNSSIGARRLGYEVQLVADACGSPSALVADLTFARLRENGVVVTGGNQLLMTLFTSFDTPSGKKAEQIGFQELISGYGL
ncbi:MAG TPA: isochorismatase family protein [Ktedonobacteraceae bacterium]|nr:isochorismatase family protein [Ktedonobacteraceae bacterium]